MVRMHEGFHPLLRHLLIDQMHMKMSNCFSQVCKSVFTLLASVLFMGSVAGQTLTISTGTSSGSGWSISSGTLTVTANSTVNVSAITTALGSGSLSIVGNTTTFAVTVSTAITSSTAGSGLTIGSSTNTGNITFSAAVSVNGSLTVYGGTISLGANLSSTGGSDISIYSDAALAGLSASRTMTTTGSFRYMPRSTSFSATTSYPISNLAFSNITELQLGKSGNTTAITFASNISVSYAVTAYGGAITMTGSITTTNTTNGNVNLNGTTISGSGNMVIAGGRTATINISLASTYSGVVSGTLSSLTKAGVGSLTLDKNQTYTGATTISGGSLQLNITSTGGNLASASDVEVQSGAKLTFRTALKVDFPNDISGTGGIDFLSVDTIKLATVNATATTIESNSNVLDVMQRITGATQFGASCKTGGGVILSGANFKLFDPVANKGYVQFQQRNLDAGNTVCVFALVEQSATNVQIKVNTTVYGTGACTIDGSKIGLNNSTGGTGVALATTNTGAGAGIRDITMSGMVYFTGALSLTGTITTLSSSLSVNDGSNIVSKNSIGAFGITGSTLPAAIANSGLFSINASSALTLSGSISSGGVTIQRGEAVTLTGSNTFSGTTIIDGGKSMTVGDGGTSGSISGNIQNYGTLTFDRSDALTYTGVISGSGTLTKSGAGTLTMTGASTYTGSTTINAGTLVMQRNAPTSGSSGFSGAGALVIEPFSASFTSAVNYPITGFTVSSSIGGLTVGKLGNTANITLNSNVTAAGPLSLFGGTVTLGGNLSTTTSDDISIYSRDPLAITGSRTVTTTGLFKYMPTGTSFASAISYPVSNLTVTSNGLQLGKVGNTAAMTITGAASSNGPVTVYTGNFTTDASATLTATGSALEVNASGSVTLNEALAGSTTTINGQGNVKTFGSLTNLNLSGTNAQDITGTATLTNLTLNKASGTATMTAGRQTVTDLLTLTSGTLDAGGFLTLKSDASGTARVAAHGATATVTGDVVVERFINSQSGSRAKQWRMLGFPFSSALTLSGISGMDIDFTSSSRSMMYYNEGGDNGVYGNERVARNAGYVSFTASSQQIAAGQGVMAWLYGNAGGVAGSGSLPSDLTVSSSGSLNESGNAVSMPVFHTGANTNKGWNLLANPFASTIDWMSSAITRTNIDPTVYRWNPASAGWTSHNANTQAQTGGADRYIESGGAFFVKAGADNPVLTIGQDAKTGTATGFSHYGRAPFRLNLPSERVPGAPLLAGIRVKASGMGNPMPDDIYIDLSRSDATPGFDSRYDAESMGRTSGAGISVRDKSDKGYAVQFDVPIAESGREKRYYPLRVTTPQVGETTIEVSTEGRWDAQNSVSLMDTKEGKTMLLQGDRLRYTFPMGSLKEEGRFVLAINHVSVEKDGKVPGSLLRLLGNPVTTDRIDLLLAHPTARPLRWELSSMNGAKVAEGEFGVTAGNVQYRLPVPGMRQSGVYVLRVEMDNGDEEVVRVLRK